MERWPIGQIRHGSTTIEPARRHRFEKPWRGGIEHRLTKPNHPWSLEDRQTVCGTVCPTNGEVERMNRTIQDAIVKRFHYDPAGLSPRVRGNPPALSSPSIYVGSIPAGAGEPASTTPYTRFLWVYPRGCGGTFPTSLYRMPCGGLSPRVRGNLHIERPKFLAEGSIPAGAGEPVLRVRAGRRVQVYPRGCGGTGAPTSRPWPGQGLSPRVRGNRASRNRERNN